jgi:branched-chain amino acid transport system substrate-binding protein
MKSNLLYVVVAAGVTVLSMHAPQAHAQQTVSIGVAAPLTGASARAGKDIENGAKLAVEEINAKGLVIAGSKVLLRLEAEDDAGDPRTATQLAQKLVDNHVVAIVGHLNSGTSIPASKIYSDAGIVQISPSATAPKYTLQGFKTTYRVVSTDAQQGPALARYAANTLKVRRIAVIDDTTAYGQGLADEFTKQAKTLGMTILSRDATSPNALDFRGLLTKIKGEQPDAMMYGGMDFTVGPFARQAAQLGIKAKVLAGDGVCGEQLSNTAGSATDHIICSEAGSGIEKMPGGAAFETRFAARFHEPIQVYAPYAYDAVYVIVDAMKRANSYDPSRILAAMPATNHDGVIGNIQFDQHGDLKNGVISIYQYRSGKKTLVDVVRM